MTDSINWADWVILEVGPLSSAIKIFLEQNTAEEIQRATANINTIDGKDIYIHPPSGTDKEIEVNNRPFCESMLHQGCTLHPLLLDYLKGKWERQDLNIKEDEKRAAQEEKQRKEDEEEDRKIEEEWEALQDLIEKQRQEISNLKAKSEAEELAPPIQKNKRGAKPIYKWKKILPASESVRRASGGKEGEKVKIVDVFNNLDVQKFLPENLDENQKKYVRDKISKHFKGIQPKEAPDSESTHQKSRGLRVINDRKKADNSEND